jgi:formylglycine-generating enzyme required for sulfatase activity
LTKLKEEHAKTEAEWEAARKQHEETLCILCSQIGEAERHKAAAEQKKTMPSSPY